MIFSAIPGPQGLYDPANEHDGCGVAMVADIRGRRSHASVADALIALGNLEHRGAAGAEPTTGDGAGILIQLPDELLRAETDFPLPEPDRMGRSTYAAGIALLHRDHEERDRAVEVVHRIAGEEGLEVLGWRDVPIAPDTAGVGPTAKLHQEARIYQRKKVDHTGRSGQAVSQKAGRSLTDFRSQDIEYG